MLRRTRCGLCTIISSRSASSLPSSASLASLLPNRPSLPSASFHSSSSLRHLSSSPISSKASAKKKAAARAPPPKAPPPTKKKKAPPLPPPAQALRRSKKSGNDDGLSWYTAEMEEDIRASCTDNISQLNREIEHFSDFLRPTEDEESSRREAFLEIASFLKRFCHAETYAIGSLETQLYLPQGDTDMVVMVEPRPNLFQLAAKLVRENLIYEPICLGRARVPIIKCYSSRTSLPVDISFNKSNGIDTAKLINRYLDDSPALRPLIMILKMFLQSRRMADPASGGLGSYSVICMAVSFFQNHPRILSGDLDPDVSPGECLVDFLHLYGKLFHPDLLSISIADSSLPQRSKGDGDSSVLRIIDPQDSSNNIAKPSFQFVAVQASFAEAYKQIATDLKRPFDPSTSLLRRIVGNGAEILNYRRQRNPSLQIPSPRPRKTPYSSLTPPSSLPSLLSASTSAPNDLHDLSSVILPQSLPEPSTTSKPKSSGANSPSSPKRSTSVDKIGTSSVISPEGEKVGDAAVVF